VLPKESVKHTKHVALTKPLGGEYHRNEWGILGAPCHIIHRLTKEITSQLSGKLHIGYLDAAHKDLQIEHSYYTLFTDKIGHRVISTLGNPGLKQKRKSFADLDLLLVNGNHFTADKQIVIVNEKKRESLHRKMDRLTDVRAILVDKENEDIPAYLDPFLSHAPVISLNDTTAICDLISEDLEKTMPPLLGLVLAGGKSQRMGMDKGSISYHGKAHREYTADLVSVQCSKVFMSLTAEQAQTVDTRYDVLKDTFTGLGPFGALLSAFREYPNHAWLTIACDLPFIDKGTISQLVEGRDPRYLATCFHNPETGFPEPLITIWEPRAYPVLLEFLSEGYSCPRKVLINSHVLELEMTSPYGMTNANDPESKEDAQQRIEAELAS
jgi:molybdopterin-guanine dinucleotide biosynthesis protein A